MALNQTALNRACVAELTWKPARKIVWSLSVAWFLVFVCVGLANAQEAGISRKEKSTIKYVRDSIEDAQAALERGRAPVALKEYEAAVDRLIKLESPSKECIAELRVDLENLATLKKMLEDAGGQPTAVPTLGTAMAEGAEAISFTKQVAAILVAKCGNCHVRGSRGQFGMATYDALLRSDQVEPGDPVSSRLIQVIDSGEMPKGGLKVTDGELATLRAWIAAGARNDGAGDASLMALAGQPAGGNPETEAMEPLEVTKPSGKETVSFARDIAPVLVENCSGCHIDAQQPRGGLNMTTFTALLRGGDTGVMLQLKDASESLLVKKLRGTGGGNRMPGGRPPLKDEVIAMIEKWIAEGATFDGPSATQPVTRVAAVARAAGMGHDELAADRAKLAAENWKKALPGVAMQTAENAESLILTTANEAAAKEWSSAIEDLAGDIRKELKLGKDPLVPGKLTVYVFDRRYDFNEFQVMVEGHAAPRDQTVAWMFDSVDAYVVALTDRDGPVTDKARLDICRGLVASAVATWGAGTPKWFADGLAYQVTANIFSKNDEARGWLAKASSMAVSDDQIDRFLDSKLSDDQMGMIGHHIVNQLQSTTQFRKLTDALKEGQAFDDAFQSAYGATYQEYLRPRRTNR